MEAWEGEMIQMNNLEYKTVRHIMKCKSMNVLAFHMQNCKYTQYWRELPAVAPTPHGS